MSEEECPEYGRYSASMMMLTSVITSIIFVVLTLTLFFADTTNGMVGIVLFLLYVSMVLFTFVTGESLAAAFIYAKPKPPITTREKVVDALFLAAILLWLFAVDFMFLLPTPPLVYHFAASVTITVIAYAAMVAYTFMATFKHR